MNAFFFSCSGRPRGPFAQLGDQARINKYEMKYVQEKGLTECLNSTYGYEAILRHLPLSYLIGYCREADGGRQLPAEIAVVLVGGKLFDEWAQFAAYVHSDLFHYFPQPHQTSQ